MRLLAHVINYEALHAIDKQVLYAMLYRSPKWAQRRIDEEGCGAVYCAAKVE